MTGIFITTLLVFGLAMIGLAVGKLAGRRGTIRGCAAVNTPEEDTQECGVCGRQVAPGGCAGENTLPENGINQG